MIGTLSCADPARWHCPRSTALREQAVNGTSEGPSPTAVTEPEPVRPPVTERRTPPQGEPCADPVAQGGRNHRSTDHRSTDHRDTDFAAAFAAAPLPLAVVDRDGHVVAPNDAFA